MKAKRCGDSEDGDDEELTPTWLHQVALVYASWVDGGRQSRILRSVMVDGWG